MGLGSCPRRKTITALCGLPLSEIRKAHRKLLFEEFIPWWRRFGIDEKNGGFFSQMAPEGTLEDPTKNMWYQGRGIWTFSYMYNHFDDDRRNLDAALRAAEFILKFGRDHSGDWHYFLSPEGNPASELRNVFSGIFVIYGLVELYRASGEPVFLDTAVGTGLRIAGEVESPQFRGVDPALPPGTRVHGLWMIFVSALTELLKEHQNADIEAAVRRYTRYILDYHRDARSGLIIENLDHGFERLPGDLNSLVNVGHVGECVWMLKHEAERTGNAGLAAQMLGLLEPHLRAGWDSGIGGIWWSIDARSGRPMNPVKSGWAHQELMLSLLEAIEHGGDEWAVDWYERIYRYAFAVFPDRANGQWHRVVGPDNVLLPYAPGQKFIGNETRDIFHFPRYLMFTDEILGRIEKRSGLR